MYIYSIRVFYKVLAWDCDGEEMVEEFQDFDGIEARDEEEAAEEAQRRLYEEYGQDAESYTPLSVQKVGARAAWENEILRDYYRMVL